MEYILSLDQGTTSSRAILFDKDGKARYTAQNEFKQIYPQAGWVEHNPMLILESQFGAIRQVLDASGADASSIGAVGITNQRETTVLWEKDTGWPLSNAIVWQCRRSAGICDALRARGLEPLITEKTGLVIDAYFSATKLLWLLDNIPGARRRAENGELLFGTIDTWLIWNLTGAHVTDYTNASRTMLFNIDKLCWDEELLRQLDIPACLLPSPLPSNHIYGFISPIPGLERLKGVPLAGAAGDQHAALFGQACLEPGQIKNTYGTGCFTLMNTGKTRIRSQNRLISTIAWGLDGQVEYALEGSVFNAGSAIKWLRDGLGMISSASETDRLAESVRDTQGVYMVPAFTGLGAPYWDMYARGALIGLTQLSGRAHIARAVLESIAYQVTDLVLAMKEDSGIVPSSLRVDGGASVSDFMMQFQADMLGVAVDRPENVETTAFGAAFLAGLAVGFWQDKRQLSALRASQRIFEPSMPQNVRNDLYTGWKRAVARALDWAAN